MKVELRDGSFDYAQLEYLAQAITDRASQQSMFQVARNSFRADAPQLNIVVDRPRDRRLGHAWTRSAPMSARATSSRSQNSSAKCSRVCAAEVTARSAGILEPLRAQQWAAWCRSVRCRITTVSGPRDLTLYNLYPAATVVANTARGFSRDGFGLLKADRQRRFHLAGYEWTASSIGRRAQSDLSRLRVEPACSSIWCCRSIRGWIALTVIDQCRWRCSVLPERCWRWATPRVNLPTQIGSSCQCCRRKRCLIVEFARALPGVVEMRRPCGCPRALRRTS